MRIHTQARPKATSHTATRLPLGLNLVTVFVRFVFLVSLASLVSCNDENPTSKIGSPSEMGERLNKSLPKGTALQTAKEFMLKEGFSCESRVDAKWKSKHHLNFLECKREDGTPPIKRLWDVAVIHDGATVILVDVRAALVYP